MAYPTGDTVADIKKRIATYLGRDTVTDLNPSNLPGSGEDFDLAHYAMNKAKRAVELMVDLRYAENIAGLSITSAGGDITDATGLSNGATIKRIKSVELPIAGGDYLPIEFLTDEEWKIRAKRAAGRTVYSAGATLTSLGIVGANPTAYQDGQVIFLVPAAQFTFPVTARINVVELTAPYTDDADVDLFTLYAPYYLQWKAIEEINAFFRRFAGKQEGNITDEAVASIAQVELQALLQWNAAIVSGTTTPPGTDA